MRQLFVVVAVLVAAAGCGSTSPQDQFDKWAARAVSADVMSARENAEIVADNLVAHLPVKAVAVASVDSCTVDDGDLWHSQQDEFACSLQQVHYVQVDGPLLPLLVKIDGALLAKPGLVPSEPLQNVQYYFAHGGKDSDGRQLSKPQLAYEGGFGVIAVNWHDAAFPEPAALSATYPMRWPEVYRTQGPAVDPQKLGVGHDNLLAIFVSQTYFKLPWPASD